MSVTTKNDLREEFIYFYVVIMYRGNNMDKKTIRMMLSNIGNMNINLYPSGGVAIDTIIYINDEDHHESVIATTDTFKGERFSWVGNFIYKYEVMIDIDPF